MTTQQTPGRRDPRLDRSRSAILSAAVELLAEGGVRQVTIEAVTARSGVARSTLYRHFPNSTELLAAAFQELIPPLRPPGSGSPRQRLLRLVLAQAEQIERAPALAALVWMATIGLSGPPGPDDGERSRLTALREHVVDTYRRPFDAVLADCLPGGADADFAASRLVGPLLFNALITRRPSDEPFCARLVDDFLATQAS
ncbi:TetR/AcrR family transcriptional regulator [Amycolatopsis thermophila]|uniref:AcrR family transcriptional regulator n=1 Tax=Amycolatopsis thermophila TaxID=206084 RepID=A0ABU0F677_9PSEU|nr:TetR/AcrR family transcriptional regulator [Amycolatopsis thermophila]MDQ0383099.1 AcrR family transcriptional regulator [Amycolatopsis thermophila]